MAFVVETGMGLVDANSYVSVEDADGYFSDRNNAAWAVQTTQDKQAALIYATSFIDNKFDWSGVILSVEQSLDWPRVDAFDVENRPLAGIPRRLKEGVCELALIHLTTEAVNSTFDRGGNITKESVGSISVEYMVGAPAGVTYPFLDELLATITISGSDGTVELVRS